MGCCLTTAASAATGKTKHGRPENSKPKSESPPPAVEEETVKEVLSETPIVPKTPPPPPKIPQSEELKTENDVVALVKKKNPTEEIHESVSEVSEMYSYSESFSAATTATVAESKLDDVVIEIDDDGEVTQKVKNSSPPAKRVLRKRPAVYSGELPRRKERDRVVRATARRTEVPSPEKKGQTLSRTMTTGRHRNVGPSNDARREIPARRSRSPAVRVEAGQRRKVRERSPAEKSGDRKQVNAGKNEGVGTVEKAGGVSPEPQTSESLENPLVSLECFIFL